VAVGSSAVLCLIIIIENRKLPLGLHQSFNPSHWHLPAINPQNLDAILYVLINRE
jgi:hypothetical protein